MPKTQELYDQGRVLEAAKLGSAKAQSEFAQNYYSGINGFEEDFDKAFEWASKAAEAGDVLG